MSSSFRVAESDAGYLYLAKLGVISASLCSMAWSP
jgi:hypothetical protein